MRRPVICTLALVISLPLASCSDAGSTPCAEFGEMAYNERDATLIQLLRDHRLDESHVGNSLGVQSAVDSFCGTRTNLLFDDEPASQNFDQQIDDAVDWDSSYW